MTNSAKKIRDFIYLDVPKLYSIYSQVFEGVADKITNERITDLMTRDAQQIRNAEAESESSETARRSESGFLHDHMYNKLEDKLSTIFAEPNASGESAPTLVRVSGPVEIHDYERMLAFIDQYNSLVEAIAFAQMSTFKKELQVKIKAAAMGGAEQRQLQKELSMADDPSKLAKKMGLAQDEKLINYFKSIVSMFTPDAYHVVILGSGNAPRYRAVVDRRWLRYEPHLVRSLYGDESSEPWTLVGQVTSISAQAAESESEKAEPDAVGMMGPIRGMMEKIRQVERMFFATARPERIVAPLAIYRDF